MSIQNIAIIGFGVVGQGLYRLTQAAAFPQLSVKYIIARDATKERPSDLPAPTFDVSIALSDPEVDTVVELTSDPGAAFQIVQQALWAGKDVVTANKQMVAAHLEQLTQLQKATGKRVLYEAAVCGSIPILQTLDSYFHVDRVKTVEGIFNGTTNYILTRIAQGKSYGEALAEAQVAGYAEADPTADVEGYDARAKLAIQIAHAFGVVVQPKEIVTLGISRLEETDARQAAALGCIIKLVAHAALVDGQVKAWVLPQWVPAESALAAVQGAHNVVQVESQSAGWQQYSGAGAGAFPTGLAVWADLERLRQGQAYRYGKLEATQRLHALHEEEQITVYLRGSRELIQQLKVKDETIEVLTHESLITSISLSVLKQWLVDKINVHFVSYLPHEVAAAAQRQLKRKVA